MEPDSRCLTLPHRDRIWRTVGATGTICCGGADSGGSGVGQADPRPEDSRPMLVLMCVQIQAARGRLRLSFGPQLRLWAHSFRPHSFRPHFLRVPYRGPPPGRVSPGESTPAVNSGDQISRSAPMVLVVDSGRQLCGHTGNICTDTRAAKACAATGFPAVGGG